MRASFLFVGDLNGHHQEWLSSTTTNSHGVAVFDFTAVSGCDQLVVGLTRARGGILDLLMTDVPDLIRVAVEAPIGNSDHSSLSVVISTAHAVANLCVSRKVFLKHLVNWNTVAGPTSRETSIFPWVGRHVPTKIISVRNKEKPWFYDQCRRAFDLKQEAHLRWTRDCSRVNWELTKLRGRKGGAGTERAMLLYVEHLQLISTLKIGVDCCQLCQYKLTKPNLT